MEVRASGVRVQRRASATCARTWPRARLTLCARWTRPDIRPQLVSSLTSVCLWPRAPWKSRHHHNHVHFLASARQRLSNSFGTLAARAVDRSSCSLARRGNHGRMISVRHRAPTIAETRDRNARAPCRSRDTTLCMREKVVSSMCARSRSSAMSTQACAGAEPSPALATVARG